MNTEPRRGEPQGQRTAPGACLCPVAAAAALTPPPDSSELEQALLSRADLLQLHQGGVDRRRERRMRNRASAERSRARRYAYVNELENELCLLRQENERLKGLCQELEEAAKVQVPPVTKTKTKTKTTTPRRLQRTSSLPF